MTVGEGALREAARFICERAPGRILIVADEKVASLWKAETDALFASLPGRLFVHGIKDAEKEKDLESASAVLSEMASAGFDRSDMVVSFGGGAVTDLAGFVSGVYMRGIALTAIPTSIVSMTDSAFGGKNALDAAGVKNVIGTIYQPSAVFCEPGLLSTMDRRELDDGYGEIIKYDMISGEDVSSITDTEKMIASCVRIKERFVRNDEFDRSERRILNFGHTFGHALEAESGYSISHGRAVGYGMKLITAAACIEGKCPKDVYDRLSEKLSSRGIGDVPYVPSGRIEKMIKMDKKGGAGAVTLVMPSGSGRMTLQKTPVPEVLRLYEEAQKWM